ncbi:DNA polymerase III chi subunit [Caballeronia glathei]|jgi:DNA polymerase-3 subunit chi|uniref:DNA polymerase III subunit chi n=1 Tax=Caballeronia glathei TaxID=60547 RepID=A0A069PUD6_9BURK|nr:DNA polymerase III subunit chi [Caballeronia glathei]KDR44398.1 DNA polymerase III subunit chi [Caballeronia glathei]CDY74130.1 DNA polymerase III chi subunit [Caballeronia glathei]
MTRIDFHSNVGDSIAYACRLVRKAYLSGQPIVVLAEPDRLAAFDEQLWTFSPLDFVPHCMAASPLAKDTPVVLAANLDEVPHHQILVNLGMSVPPQFARFERLLEVVGNEEQELAAGRERYRFYRDRGYALNNYKQGG